jgi:hypothetical protein
MRGPVLRNVLRFFIDFEIESGFGQKYGETLNELSRLYSVKSQSSDIESEME